MQVRSLRSRRKHTTLPLDRPETDKSNTFRNRDRDSGWVCVNANLPGWWSTHGKPRPTCCHVDSSERKPSQTSLTTPGRANERRNPLRAATPVHDRERSSRRAGWRGWAETAKSLNDVRFKKGAADETRLPLGYVKFRWSGRYGSSRLFTWERNRGHWSEAERSATNCQQASWCALHGDRRLDGKVCQ